MIDEIDHQILIQLQEDGRLSNAALGKRVGIPASTVHGRIKRLEKRGVIKKYVVVVDAEKVDKPITAFLRLSVGVSEQDYLTTKTRVIAVCQAEPDILECHAVAGEDCYIIKVRVASPKKLEKLIERIRCQAKISRSITSIVLSTFKESSFVLPHQPTTNDGCESA